MGDDCSLLNGNLIAGTILETLNDDEIQGAVYPSSPSPAEENSRMTRKLPAAAVLSSGECKTIVETMATLLQLRWIFSHPTTTVYSLLSAHHDGDTNRDYLLLKGVLEHGLSNELEFRTQQQQQQSSSTNSMTYHEVEDRICVLTKLLFKQLQDVRKKEAATSLKRKYCELLNIHQ